VTRRLLTWVFTLAATGLPLAASHASAPVWAAARFELTPTAPTDPAVQTLLADQPQAHIVRAIAADVDHDGDLDIVAVTNEGLALWINDGAGHFARRQVAASSTLRDASNTLAPIGDSQALAFDLTPTNGHAISVLHDLFIPTASRLALATPQSARHGRRMLGQGPVRAPPASIVTT
jgi:hypothetical protein